MSSSGKAAVWCAIGFMIGMMYIATIFWRANPTQAPGTDTVGTVTVDLPSGHYTYKAEGAYKYGSDGKLLWCRVKPWTANSK